MKEEPKVERGEPASGLEPLTLLISSDRSGVAGVCIRLPKGKRGEPIG
jgi:hypothetical protein